MKCTIVIINIILPKMYILTNPPVMASKLKLTVLANAAETDIKPKSSIHKARNKHRKSI